MTTERPLRIAVWHNLKGGGGKRALHEQVKRLAARGHHIETWCPDSADLDFLALDPFGPRHVLPLPDPAARRGLRRAVFPGRYRPLDLVDGMDRHCARCAQDINAGGFDVLFANACFFLAVPAIARHVRCPSLLFLQEPCRRLYEAWPTLPWSAPPDRAPWWSPRTLKRAAANRIALSGLRVQARAELENVRAHERILVNSFYSRESLLRAYGVEAYVCYLGVDTDLFKPTGAPRERMVLASGGLFPAKRPDRAIRAIATIDKPDRPPLRWIGHFTNDDYRREIEELARDLEVDFQVEVQLDNDDIIDRLSRAAVFLFTAQLEPLGLAPIEANACETPVVAIAEGGVRETVRHGVNGLLVPHDDPRTLGAALLSVLDDPDFARRMGAQAREHVIAHWDWETPVGQLETHLRKIAAR